ncbi:hypothetical protein UFOVP1078_17 [uncultured Caudovirales phage]|uniref:Uncharacterized protein n=1 Tax=uncultured Caudovirales phage TaxID=2100421 RepID=A0A6J5MY11_9CAUD|nr:hypothetical protein UFOVP289_28 [uncultured Caudovirales phage]CAB4149966.1 hypothetical protein UFOVP547_19 [uncultured Caudovirales phage]CAB4170113.1 hypothetical protein UFOVP900_50 [uncultured Caudovirales phage]CAB4182662.1 hypothetical protein UFOVP1078_17 [uncultured Caudovirales phage]CAB4197355.1 hypothetical protein UFOVP1317_7 [uncultured Caudovirales phage]
MPLMMTDVAKGQEAALQLDLQPLRAEAERERIPLETEKMQQNLQTSKLSQQKEMLQIQALVEAQKDDASAKTLIGDLSKDPAFKDLPIPDQMLRIGQGLAATGKFKQAEEFYSRGERAKLQEAQTQKANFDIQQNKLDKAQSYLTMLNDDGSNANEVMMAARTDGALTESELKILSQRGQEALNAGKFKAFKTDALRNINSIKGKAEVAQEADKKEQRRIQAGQLAETIRRDTMNNNRLIAAVTSRESTVESKAALSRYTTSSRLVQSASEQIRRLQKQIDELPPKVTTNWYGAEKEDPNAEKRKAIEDNIARQEGIIDEQRDVQKQAIDQMGVVIQSQPTTKLDRDKEKDFVVYDSPESAQKAADIAGRTIRVTINGKRYEVDPEPPKPTKEDKQDKNEYTRVKGPRGGYIYSRAGRGTRKTMVEWKNQDLQSSGE